MKKLKQLSLILFLSVGLFSCEAEKVDPDVKNEYLEGKQIFRCEVDGVTRVTDSVSVSSTGNNVQITAYLLSSEPDEAAKYKYDTFVITLNKLATGNYISSLGNLLADETMGITSATYKLASKTWSYSTNNLVLTPGLDVYNLNLQTGSLSIESINDKAKYFEGEFQFDVYPPENQNPSNTIAPIRLRNGYFQYIKYN